MSDTAYAPWLDDADPPDYMTDADLEKMLYGIAQLLKGANEKAFDESEHPRDEHGKFTDADGGDEPQSTQIEDQPYQGGTHEFSGGGEFTTWGGQLDYAKDNALFVFKEAGADNAATRVVANRLAAEAVVTLGENRVDQCEFGVIIGGNAKTGGINVGVVRGRSSSVSPDDTIRQLEQASPGEMFEFHHNHPGGPTTGCLSSGDLEWLNASPKVQSISSHDSDGGHFKASIPGRDYDHSSSWILKPVHEKTPTSEITTENQFYWIDCRLDEFFREPVVEENTAGSILPSIDRGSLRFILAHASRIGMDAAGIIKYEYKLGSRQQLWINEHPVIFEVAVQKATELAKSLKMEKV